MKLSDQVGAQIVQTAPLCSRWPFADPTVAIGSQARPGRSGGTPATLTAAFGPNHTVQSPLFALWPTYSGDVIGDSGAGVVPIAGHVMDFWAFPDDAQCVLEILGYTSAVGVLVPHSEHFFALPPFQNSQVTGFRIPFEYFRLLISNADPDIDTPVTYCAIFRTQ